jgi:hypothetical protein
VALLVDVAGGLYILSPGRLLAVRSRRRAVLVEVVLFVKGTPQAQSDLGFADVMR